MFFCWHRRPGPISKTFVGTVLLVLTIGLPIAAVCLAIGFVANSVDPGLHLFQTEHSNGRCVFPDGSTFDPLSETSTPAVCAHWGTTYVPGTPTWSY
jgi:hypothetical protein